MIRWFDYIKYNYMYINYVYITYYATLWHVTLTSLLIVPHGSVKRNAINTLYLYIYLLTSFTKNSVPIWTNFIRPFHRVSPYAAFIDLNQI